MVTRLRPDEERLLALARQQAATIQDAALRECWDVVVKAIGQRWLVPEGPVSLLMLIEGLERGGGSSVEEYAIMVDDEDTSTAVASFVTDEHRCPREAMLRELRRLEARRADDTPARPPPSSSSQAPEQLPDSDALRRLVQLLLGAQAEGPPESDVAERIRAQVREDLAALQQSPEALRSNDMREALAGLSDQDRAAMANALRTFAKWAEHPESGGAAVDDIIRVLERTLGRFARGGPAEERARQARIAQSAQDAIARRLRGFS